MSARIVPAHGDWALLDSRAPRPLLSGVERRRLVRLMRRKAADLGLYCNPKALARRLGFVCVYGSPDDERVDNPRILVYAWDKDERERGFRVFLLLVGALLRQLRVAHNASDVWLVAIDVAVPFEATAVDADEMILLQQHVPEDVIRRVIAARQAGQQEPHS
jgi:hypothetical protein